MSTATRFLTSFSQALATMALYPQGHPTRMRALEAAYRHLTDLQSGQAVLRFSFLGDEVVLGQEVLRDLRGWPWAARLAKVGLQRLEFESGVTFEAFEDFLEEVQARLTVNAIDSAEARHTGPSSIRFGLVGIRGDGGADEPEDDVPAGDASSDVLLEEAETLGWLHDEVSRGGGLPIVEAEAVVQSLSFAMHADRGTVLPLLKLKEFDQYTTTHSMNVAVLTMALAEHLSLSAREVRTYGVAGLLHDLGKVRIPHELLVKPGRLTEQERKVIQRHPVEGARIILEDHQELDLAAAVAYEHHIMINGGGYPHFHFPPDTHYASRLVHVCDVYDALRTKRPYRDAWESERVLSYIADRGGTEFDPVVAKAFIEMMRKWDSRVVALPVRHEAPPTVGNELDDSIRQLQATIAESQRGLR